MNLRSFQKGSRESVPFFGQQEVAEIPVLDPVAAHIKLIQRDNMLGEVIPDADKSAELPLNRLI